MPDIAHPRTAASGWIVACLCAEWCGTCRAYRAAFDTLREANPADAFAWVDVEDDADWMGDIDVENFPTLLIAKSEVAYSFGTVLPHPVTIARLLENARTGQPASGIDHAQLAHLLERLKGALESSQTGDPA